MYNLGIVGNGVVGKATAKSFEHGVDKVLAYDKYTDCPNTLEEVAIQSDIIFISVPTPTIDNKQDLGAIEDVISELIQYSTKAVVVIKSTILPGTTRILSEKYYPLKIIFCPEFLTEANPFTDSKYPSRVIIGSQEEISTVYDLHKMNFTCPIYQCTWEEAELTKYVANSFLAMKVVFSNIMFEVATSMDLPWEKVQKMWLDDRRVGKSHTDVPGDDGKFGYGGTCFPKDVKAFITWMNNNKLDASLLQTVNDINERIR